MSDAGGAQRFAPGAALSRSAPAGSSLIATARARVVRVHTNAVGGARGSRLLRARPRIPLTFLVVAHRPGWVRVMLPTRPNRSRGWVRRGAVRLSYTRVRVTVHPRRHLLVVRDGARVLLRAPIAVGRALSPTPRGRYYVTDLVRARDPGGFYGPYALGLSGHSPVYTRFEGGDGQIGIHGTNDPGAIGHDVSHGCIRVTNAVVRRLAHVVPLGAPVTIGD